MFPVRLVKRSNGKVDKIPLVKWNPVDGKATTDPKGIMSLWWHEPDLAVGIATGMRSGVYVVDIDDPSRLEELGLDLAGSQRVKSQRRGGWHHYFGPPEDGLPAANAADAGGVDFRGDGGMVVAWPGAEEVGELTPLRASVAAWARSHERVLQADGTWSGERFELAEVITADRNNTLSRYAWQLLHRHNGMSEQDLFTALWSENVERCAEPMSEREVTGIARHAVRRFVPRISQEAWDYARRAVQEWKEKQCQR